MNGDKPILEYRTGPVGDTAVQIDRCPDRIVITVDLGERGRSSAANEGAQMLAVAFVWAALGFFMVLQQSDMKERVCIGLFIAAGAGLLVWFAQRCFREAKDDLWWQFTVTREGMLVEKARRVSRARWQAFHPRNEIEDVRPLIREDEGGDCQLEVISSKDERSSKIYLDAPREVANEAAQAIRGALATFQTESFSPS